MNTVPLDPKRGILDGTKELIDAALNAPTGHTSITTANDIDQGNLPNVDYTALIESLWKQIAVNWVEGGCQSRGKFNWRWELKKKPDIQSQQPEIILQRKIAEFSSKRWSNETPTGSGLSEGNVGDPGGLDLAYHSEPFRVMLIELKVGSNTHVSAAFQVVRYALFLTLARLVHEKISMIVDEDPWKFATHADLRVLAPNSFYKWPRQGQFETQINDAVAAFGKNHKLAMSFGFRAFDEAAPPKNEDELISCLNKPIAFAEGCVETVSEY